MLQKYEQLTKEKHQDLRFCVQPTMEFASQISAVTISFSEFRNVSRYYPVVFPLQGPCMPQVLLSLNKEQNLYLGEDGKWKVPYIPVVLRFYPFILARVQGKDNQLALCLDPDAPHFKAGMGEPLFSIQGPPTEYLKKNILSPLQKYHNELDITARRIKSLEEQEIIAERTFKFKFNGQEKVITGFKGIDTEKLEQLDDKSLADIVRNGTFSLVYEHLNSLSNFSNLVGN